MREMKDSGIAWIGEIPQKWKLEQGKYLYKIDTGHLDANAEDDDGKYPFFTCSMFPKRINTYAFNCEALLVAGNGLVGFTQYYWGKFNAYQRTYVLSNFKEINPLFLKYYVSNIFPKEANYNSVGSVISFIKYDDLANFKVCIPTTREQQAIADFLDTKCADIDSLVEDIQKQIETLKEYKKSVINQAVTKGLDPKVEMKDSRIAWCPKIPKHWNPINPKVLFTLRNDRAKQGQRQLTASQKYGIIYQDVFMKKESQKVVTVVKDFSILKQVKPNDFVISMRSFQGGLEYSTLSGSISSAYVMLIPNAHKVYPRFYKYFFKSSKYINAIQSTSNLVRDGQAMRYSNFAQVYLFDIPMEEQKEIADYLDNKIPQVDAIIVGKQKQLDVLKEYKKSLIYEYVTGKKEVPCGE